MPSFSWGFAQDPSDDLGEPISRTASTTREDVADSPSARGLHADHNSLFAFGRLSWAIGIGILAVWLTLSVGLAIAGQHAVGATPNWWLGLVLAAVSLGGGVDITTHHWALTVSSGPLVPGLVVIVLWVIAWMVSFNHQAQRSGVPIRLTQVGQSAGIGLGLFLLVATSAKLTGAMITVGGQQVWISPSIPGMVLGALMLPLASVAAGIWYLDVIPDALHGVLRQVLFRVGILGAVIGVVIGALAISYGVNPLALALVSPVVWASGIAVGSGSPVLIQLAEGTNFLHAAWGLGGVSGTLPVGIVLPVAACSFLATAAIITLGVRDAILLTGQRRYGAWVIGLEMVVMTLALGCSHIAIVNQHAGTTPPPVVQWVAEALHNAMAVPNGAVWTLSLSLSWAVAMATLFGLLGVASAIGVALAGKPSQPWSGQELEASLRKVYKAGLIDEVAFNRGMYALSRAKQAGRKRRARPAS